LIDLGTSPLCSQYFRIQLLFFMAKHILHEFEAALDHMKADVMRMAALAEQNLKDAVQGLLTRNIELCNAVIVEDDEIDQLEKQVDLDAVQIMVKFTPQARDLRRVLTTMKVGQQLERISDEAVNIAKRARKLTSNPALPETALVQSIADLAIEMVKDSVTAFNEGDVRKALALDNRDEALDRDHSEFIKRMIERTEQDVPHVKDYVDLMFIVRFLERVGDHAVNIGEDAVYGETAYDIRHGGARPTLD
jgi:phosphate transport system protein